MAVAAPPVAASLLEALRAHYIMKMQRQDSEKNWSLIAAAVASVALAIFSSSIFLQAVGFLTFLFTASTLILTNFNQFENTKKNELALDYLFTPGFLDYAAENHPHRLYSAGNIIQLGVTFTHLPAFPPEEM